MLRMPIRVMPVLSNLGLEMGISHLTATALPAPLTPANNAGNPKNRSRYPQRPGDRIHR
jgi:hypothetical protein